MSKTILIVEDEPIISDDIGFSLQDLGYEVVGKAYNVDEAITLIEKGKPNLVLIDINLQDDRDGIELGRLLQKAYKIPFIYLTSYYDEATVKRARETEPKAYILKPFDENDLRINLQLAFHKSIKTSAPIEKLFVKREHELIAIQPESILYLEAFDNYSYLYTKTEKLMISHTLKSIEEKLSANDFIRVHRSYLVNFEKISLISEGRIYIEEYQIPIGKSYKQSLLDKIVQL